MEFFFSLLPHCCTVSFELEKHYIFLLLNHNSFFLSNHALRLNPPHSLELWGALPGKNKTHQQNEHRFSCVSAITSNMVP